MDTAAPTPLSPGSLIRGARLAMAPQYAGRPPRSEAPNLKCDGAEIGTAEERADILQVE